MSRPVCLVTGATGAIGPGVVAAIARTHDVRTLSRRSPDPGLFPTAVAPFVGDVADPGAVRRAAHGADVIVHLAALLHIVDPPPAMRSEYQRVNVGGTAAVLDAARAEGIARVVLMSTIAVYGYAGQKLLDEDSPTLPDTFYGETKLAAERLALASRRADGAPMATVLRSAAVYGPRVKGNYQRLVTALARRRFVPIGRGREPAHPRLRGRSGRGRGARRNASCGRRAASITSPTERRIASARSLPRYARPWGGSRLDGTYR